MCLIVTSTRPVLLFQLRGFEVMTANQVDSQCQKIYIDANPFKKIQSICASKSFGPQNSSSPQFHHLAPSKQKMSDSH